MRHTMRHVSLFICILLMAGAAVLIGSRGQSPSNQELGELQVTCFSLENGQAALIQCGDHAVLIDAGSADDAPALLQELDGCRSDLIRYTSALQGMSTSQRLTLFNQVPFMAGWFHKLRSITKAVSDFLTAVREQNRVPSAPKSEEEK